MPFLNVKTNHFKNPFIPAVIAKGSKLDVNIRNSNSCSVFKNSILKFIRPEPNQVFDIHNTEGLKLLTLRLGLSHSADHKFRYNFQDCLDQIA